MPNRNRSHARLLLDRRGFLQGAAVSLLGAGAWARSGRRGGARVRLAAFGVGGQGASDTQALLSSPHAELVAMCDVDRGNAAAMAQRFPDARVFADYRKLLDELAGEIDAVLVSTPDHMHGAIALAAMERGKHVYCQKPLAHNLAELRAMQRMAQEKGLITQMGTQIHGHEAYRTAAALVREGAIGKVREAHLWVGKSWAGLPGGIPDRADPIPEALDWQLWLGVAPERRYVKEIYHPGQWRRWRAFGTGTLGDMGCHIFDPVFSALGIERIESVVSRGPVPSAEGHAPDSDVTYTFAETPHTDGKLRFRWTDGSGPSRPAAERAQLPEGVALPESGSFLVGEKGVMVLPHWAMPSFYSKGERMEVAIESRGSVDHYHEFIDAVRGEGRTTTPFSYAGPVTECVLVGVVASALPGRELRWSSPELRFDDAEAQALVQRSYRPGRELRLG